ncbi:uncharacterized protein LOC142765307 [Rhipicephalus microplus]|uniref:uncharacterized protein LOC142765307 n=1 Tax=Rhipicephalus microplus TaxID=6941 RepID=UPI003F6B1483
MMLAAPADYFQEEDTPTLSKTLGTSCFSEEQNEAKVVGPIIMVAVMVGVIAAAIFTLVVRGHHALRNSSLRSTAGSITTLSPVKRNAPYFALGASTGEDGQTAGGNDSS